MVKKNNIYEEKTSHPLHEPCSGFFLWEHDWEHSHFYQSSIYGGSLCGICTFDKLFLPNS